MLAVTFDIDWAPDWAIAICAELCKNAKAPATFFVTHDADVLAHLRGRNDVELGIHPNFLPNSSHGTSTAEVIEHVLAIVPEARSVRTHALFQSSPILHHLETYTSIETDVSLFLPFCPGLRPTKAHFEAGGRGLIRLPYYWEDDTAALWPGWSWNGPQDEPPDGLRIYDFHPIHVALNMASLDAYQRLKEALNGRPMFSATEADCAPFINRGAGTRTFLERLLASVEPDWFHTVSDLAADQGR